jgi:hypothetical protein
MKKKTRNSRIDNPVPIIGSVFFRSSCKSPNNPDINAIVGIHNVDIKIGMIKLGIAEKLSENI